MFWFPLLSLFLSVSTTILAAEPPEDLVVDITYKPETCTQISENGDNVKVHYVRVLDNVLGLACAYKVLTYHLLSIMKQTGTRFADGGKFDSRCLASRICANAVS